MLAIGLSLGGCSGIREATCSEDEYPVWSVKFPESGGACVPNGQEPMRGYATYPPGLVPEYEADIIDCDSGGKCRDGPLAITCPRNYPVKPCTIDGEKLVPPRGR
jgi:hypothetical protein